MDDNVALVVVPQTLLARRDHIPGADRDVDFLSLRLLNKRGRVRLSPAAIDCTRLPGKASLFAVANARASFAAAIRTPDGSHHIVLAPLADLRTAYQAGQPAPAPFIPFSPRRPPVGVPGTPTILKFALNDERLVVAFLEGPILVYATDALVSSSQPAPLFSFPGDSSTVPRDILPNPGDSPELVAILRGVHGQNPGHHVDIVDIQSFKHVAGWRKGSDPGAAPASISWSPKGKQIAIGLQSGDLLLYAPLSPGAPKSHLPKPPATPPESSSLLSTTWLSTPAFHTVFSSQEASSALFDPATSDPPAQTHFVSTHDPKARAAADVELRDPCPPFGAKRPPGPLTVVLRNWSPTKFILFCGGGASSDIGVLGALPPDAAAPQHGDQWLSFNLEETATPSLPLDEDLNDLALLGLDIDLTSAAPVRVAAQPDDGTPDLPPAPILYAYTSDGSVVAWHVLNSTGAPYPGMHTPPQSAARAPPTVSPPAAPAAAVAPAKGFGAFAGASAPSKFGSTAFGGAAPAFGQAAPAPAPAAFGSGSGEQPKTAPAPAFGTTGFSPTSPQKPAPAFGTTGFGGAPANQQKPAPAFGTPGFAQAGAAPAFGVAGFGAKPPPAFGQSGFGGGGGGGGFASFATQGSAAFGAPVEAKPKLAAPPPFGQGSFGSAAPRSAFGAGGQGDASASASAFGSGGVGQAAPASPRAAFAAQPAPAPAPAAAPAFGTRGGGFAGLGALGDALAPAPARSPAAAGLDSPPGSPPSPAGSPPDSPELRPAATPASSSYLKPAEGFGSFGSSSKPAQGFGAFGGAAASSAASFIKPAVGAFGAGSKPPPPAFSQPKSGAAATSATPTFGSTSALGQQRKPVFGTSSFGSAPRPPAAEPAKPLSGGGFGSFSGGGGGGFAAYAGAGGKAASFADMLSAGEPARPKAGAAPLAFGGKAPSPSPSPRTLNAPASGGAASERSKGSSTPPREPTVASPTPPAKARSDSAEQARDDGAPVEKPATRQEPSLSSAGGEDPSFSLLSLEDAASQIALPSTPKSDAQAEAEPAEETTADGGKQGPEEGDDETASEPFSLTDESVSDDDDDDRLPRSPEDEESPPPPSPTPSQDRTPRSTPTPTPEPTSRESRTPRAKAPSPSPEPARVPASTDSASSTTTPPGSPEKPAAAGPEAAMPPPAAPTPVVAAPAPAVFGLGLGRPSSRPIRSSPLASAPITIADDEESAPAVSTSKSAPPTVPSGKPADPKVPPGSPSPSPVSSSSAPPAATFSGGGAPVSAKPRRPQTPPLLGTPPAVPGATPHPPGGAAALGQARLPPTGLKMPPSLPVQPPQAVPPVVAKTTPLPVVEDEEPPKHPMQIEFLRAYQEMTKELVQLFKKAQEMALIRPIIREPRGLDKLVLNNQEFVPGQYSHGDLKAFSTMISILQKRVVPLLELGDANKRSLRDLQNLALISETKREEVVRWVHARQDPDFANTLKPRTLGPEHSESQFRLRKAVQVAGNRIQQCEDKMESLKKRIEQHRSGKVGFRPPSLDTIDRTCRNIQLALEERIKLLEQLHERIGALSPKDSQRLQTPHSHTRSPVSSPASVTPPFASVAAAALNSERSSLRLKTALLSARKVPLLTTEVAKLELSKPTTRLRSQPQRPEWKLPPVPPLNTSAGPAQTISSLSRRTGRTGKRHGAVQLKDGTPESVASAKIVTFDWGPLPSAAPMDKLSADVRNSRGKSSPREQEDGNDPD